MRRLFLFLQSTAILTRHESTVLIWLTVLVVVGTVGSQLFPEPSLHAHMPPRRLIALLDSAAREQRSTDTLDPAVPQSRSTTIRAVHRAIDVTTASAAQLETVPGIGPSTARSIIEYRLRKRLTSVEDLLDIKGIGKKKLERMRPFITVP